MVSEIISFPLYDGNQSWWTFMAIWYFNARRVFFIAILFKHKT